MIVNGGPRLWHVAHKKIATWHINLILEKNKNIYFNG
jgi:hypothetical protein